MPRRTIEEVGLALYPFPDHLEASLMTATEPGIRVQSSVFDCTQHILDFISLLSIWYFDPPFRAQDTEICFVAVSVPNESACSHLNPQERLQICR